MDWSHVQTHFLPTVDLRTARMTGAAAVVRWTHPERGSIPSEIPAPSALDGHMRELTELVIERSTRAGGDWWRSGLGLDLTVNLPPAVLSEGDWRPEDVVARTLAQAGLPGKALLFGVPAEALPDERGDVSATLERLGELGAAISIDHFGTGHFSIRQLIRLPVNEVKLDRSLTGELSNEENRTIVRSTIRLAHQLGLRVLAEDVGTREAWRQLRTMGADRAQGPLISKPLPAREVPAWLAAWDPRGRGLAQARGVRRRTQGVPA